MIVLTGVTGRLGGRVARRLAGSELRLLVRDPSRAPSGAEVAVAAYKDTEAVRRGLTGAGVVFMVSGSETPDRVAEHKSFVDAAVAAGVPHLVYVSFANPSPEATFTLARDHWATEEYIKASGLTHTFLRDNLYADFLPNMAGEDGVIRGPAGGGRVALVGQDDIADCAAAVLRSPSAHAGRAYTLTGPDAITLAEAAALLSEATGRAISFHDETIDEAYASRAAYRAPDWQVDAWVSTYTAIAAGELAEVSPDVRTLSGHPATPVRDVLAAQSAV